MLILNMALAKASEINGYLYMRYDDLCDRMKGTAGMLADCGLPDLPDPYMATLLQAKHRLSGIEPPYLSLEHKESAVMVRHTG